ncbi:MAG TPA: hypothetical protein VHR45_03000 [Thermoanaerobaculia bacterium]|nr:hypothetical protein [Thermoanaerobaculia bacterium]
MADLPRKADARAGDAGDTGEAGYNLVVLVMAIAVLNVMLAASLPLWSDLIKHDKEEELISRGWQYAEAIRVFQNRFQRLPISLKELIEVKPRCIRQLWKDPMTEDGRWALIFLNQGSPIRVPGQPQVPGAPPPGKGSGGGSGGPGGEGGSGTGEVPAVGPIVGVRSRSDKSSSLIFFGHEHYDEWEFRADILQKGGASTDPLQRGPRRGGQLVRSLRWLGRPFPSFAQPGGVPAGLSPLPGAPGGGTAPRGPTKPPGG